MIDENKWYCIFNPTAGTKKHKDVWNSVHKELSSNNIEFEYYFTKFKGDAVTVVLDKIKDGYKKFIAIGGDGTVHEVVNAFLLQNKLNSTNLKLAVIPVGTGNDWSKHHGIPSDISESVLLIKKNKTSFQDIGIAQYYKNDKKQTQFFNNVAGMAYDAFVVRKLEQRKRKPNKLIYIFSVFIYLLQYKLQRAKLNIQNNEIESKFYTINIGICKYSGGGMSLVPHAIHDDGLFAVTYAKEISKLDIIKNTYRFYNETLIDHKKITGVQAKTISVESMENKPVYLELDGELVGHTPVRFEILEKALQFIC